MKGEGLCIFLPTRRPRRPIPSVFVVAIPAWDALRWTQKNPLPMQAKGAVLLPGDRLFDPRHCKSLGEKLRVSLESRLELSSRTLVG